MSLKRITWEGAVKRAGGKAKLAGILGVYKQYVGNETNGTYKRQPQKYLPDKHEKSYREYFGLPARPTRKK